MDAKKNNDTQYKNIHFCLILPPTVRNVDQKILNNSQIYISKFLSAFHHKLMLAEKLFQL